MRAADGPVPRLPAPAGPARRLWRWRAAALIAAAVAAGQAGVPLLLGPQVAVVRVERRPLVQTVVATGRVETPFRVEIGSQITSTRSPRMACSS